VLEKIAVVGGSLAALRGAEALRSEGYDGRIVWISGEPHLPYDRPPLSKDVLRGSWEPEKASLVRGDNFEKLDLELRLGRRALSLDTVAREVELDDGERIDFDGMLVATGASPRTLPGRHPAGVYTLRGLDDCLTLRAELERNPRVAIVGSGFIGAEVAATCRQRNLEVAMIDVIPLPFEAILGKEIASELTDVHREHGVALHLGMGVDGFEGSDRVEAVRLADGTRVGADVVVVGIGVAPETSWLAGSGVEVDDGIVCDATCATSVPGITAAGDVASWIHEGFGRRIRIEHWSNAVEMGRAAALRLLATSEEAEPFVPVPFFWSDQYDVKLQSAGDIRDPDVVEVVHGSIQDRKFLALCGRKGQLTGAIAWGEPRRLMGVRRRLREPPTFEEALRELA